MAWPIPFMTTSLHIAGKTFSRRIRTPTTGIMTNMYFYEYLDVVETHKSTIRDSVSIKASILLTRPSVSSIHPAFDRHHQIKTKKKKTPQKKNLRGMPPPATHRDGIWKENPGPMCVRGWTTWNRAGIEEGRQGGEIEGFGA